MVRGRFGAQFALKAYAIVDAGAPRQTGGFHARACLASAPGLRGCPGLACCSNPCLQSEGWARSLVLLAGPNGEGCAGRSGGPAEGGLLTDLLMIVSKLRGPLWSGCVAEFGAGKNGGPVHHLLVV